MDNDLLFRRSPPVRIGLSIAAIKMREMRREAPISGQGNRHYVDAGEFGQRELRFSSVPVMLRFVRNAGLGSQQSLRNVKPIGFTQRKRGFPPPDASLAGVAAGVQGTPGARAAGSARNWGMP